MSDSPIPTDEPLRQPQPLSRYPQEDIMHQNAALAEQYLSLREYAAQLEAAKLQLEARVRRLELRNADLQVRLLAAVRPAQPVAPGRNRISEAWGGETIRESR